MRKFFVALVLFFSFTSLAFPRVIIEKTNRIENRSPGFCVWACLETLGRHHKIKALYNLLENRANESDFKTWDSRLQKYVNSPYVWVDYPDHREKDHCCNGSPRAVINKLNALGIKYRLQDRYNYDRSIIRYAIENQLGCVFIVYDWTGRSNVRHAIILVDSDDDGIEFLDTNNIGSTYTASWDWFNKNWTGYTIVVEKQ